MWIRVFKHSLIDFTGQAVQFFSLSFQNSRCYSPNMVLLLNLPEMKFYASAECVFSHLVSERPAVG